MTGVRSADLLRVLGSGVRPGADAPARAGRGPSFADLLGRAREGTLETGLPVSVADGAAIDLSREQLDRLSAVVDRAHAAGATRIVVMMDGLALDVDVLSRRVLGPAALDDETVLTGIDGVVRLGAATADLPRALPLPGVPTR